MKSNKKILTMVQIALLGALAVVLSMFQIPIIAGLSLNFALVPIVIAAVAISPAAGCLIGALSGITTGIQTFMLVSSVPLYQVFIGTSGFFTFGLCVAKTALAGLVSGLVFKALTKDGPRKASNVFLPAALCPIVNTGIFCLGVILVFAKPLAESAEFGPLVSNGHLLSFVFIGLVGVNFLVEFILNLILCPAIAKALFSTKYFKK
ncbi:MAG: energy-coupled thiamine transporter ThiT [Clostridia bacterium]|nr:energy-coupled thiamine transporter ThiT [Clostridia bacterium]